MRTLHQWKFVGAAVLVVVAIALLWRSMATSRPGGQIARIELENADTALLQGIDFGSPAPAGVHAPSRAELERLIVEVASASGISGAHAQALGRIAAERVTILLKGTHSEYAESLRTRFGLEAVTLGQDYAADPVAWEDLSRHFREAPISLEGLTVRRVTAREDGERVLFSGASPAGRFSYRLAPAAYRPLLTPIREREVVEVYIPMVVRELDIPEMQSGGKSHRCFLVLGFAWDARGQRWIPYRAGVNDPSNKAEGILPVPWM